MENVHFIISFHYELFELFVRICNNFANNINYFRLVESLKWLVITEVSFLIASHNIIIIIIIILSIDI